MLSPTSADTGRVWTSVMPRPCRDQRASSCGDLGVGRAVVVDQVDLVDGDDDGGDPQQCGDGEVPPGLLEHPLADVDEQHRASAVEAPVTMLRVYCTCPGQSARMNVRAAVAK